MPSKQQAERAQGKEKAGPRSDRPLSWQIGKMDGPNIVIPPDPPSRKQRCQD